MFGTLGKMTDASQGASQEGSVFDLLGKPIEWTTPYQREHKVKEATKMVSALILTPVITTWLVIRIFQPGKESYDTFALISYFVAIAATEAVMYLLGFKRVGFLEQNRSAAHGILSRIVYSAAILVPVFLCTILVLPLKWSRSEAVGLCFLWIGETIARAPCVLYSGIVLECCLVSSRKDEKMVSTKSVWFVVATIVSGLLPAIYLQNNRPKVY